MRMTKRNYIIFQNPLSKRGDNIALSARTKLAVIAEEEQPSALEQVIGVVPDQAHAKYIPELISRISEKRLLQGRKRGRGGSGFWIKLF